MTGRSLVALVALVAGCAPAPSRVTAAELVGMWRGPAPASSCDASPVGRLDYNYCGVTLMRLNADSTATVNGSFDAHGCNTGTQSFPATWRLTTGGLEVAVDCSGMTTSAVFSCPTPEDRRALVCFGVQSQLLRLEVSSASMLTSPYRVEGRGFTWTR